jgi:hypothetical protein
MIIAARSSQDFGTQLQILPPRAKNPHRIGSSRALPICSLSAKREQKGSESTRAAPKITEEITEFFAAFAGRSQKRSRMTS